MSVSAVFDQNFYLTNNADIVLAISQGQFSSAIAHFDQFGGKELRAPNATFNPSYYAINNPDVLNAVASGTFSNVFSHFQEFGETENRAPSSVYAAFSSDTYLAANTDVAAAITAGSFTSALDHFIQFGQNESRSGGITVTDPVTGTAFNLTTGLDTLVGTSNNDSFQGIDDGNATSTTSTLGDSIDGGAGTDSLTITSNQGNGQQAAGSQLPTLTNVENFTVIESGEHEDINVSANTALTTLTLSSGTTDADQELNVTVGAGQTVNFTSFADGDTANDGANDGDVEIESAASVTSISVGLNAVGATGATADVDLLVNGTGVSSMTIDSAGASTNFISLENAGTALRTVTVTGSAALNANAIVDGVTTFNASAATGNITAAFGAGNDTVTGGSGNDNFSFTVGNFLAADAVDGGDGTDILTLADTAVSTAGSAALMTEIQASTSIETLAMSSTTAESSLDANDVSTISSFVVSGTITDAQGADSTATVAAANGAAANNQAFSYTGIENDDSLEFDAVITGGVGGAGGVLAAAGANVGNASGNGADGSAGLLLTPDLDGGSNTASLTLDGAASIVGGAGGAGARGGNSNVGNNGGTGGNGGDGATGISAANIETLNINSIGTGANAITGGAGGALGTGGTGANITGASGIAGAAAASITVNTNATINVTGSTAIDIGTISGTNVTVDASTFTGALTVVAEAGNNTITGGTGADSINGGTGIDVLTGGAGADDFVFTAAANATGGTPAAGVFERITDFNNGADEIDYSVTLTIEAASATAVAQTAQINTEGFATFASADDTFAEKLVAVENGIAVGTAAAGEYAIFTHASDTYIFVGDVIDGIGTGDGLIQLTGVTGLSNSTLTAGDLFLS
jgi:hypothetical protein